MHRVLILSYYFPPLGMGGTQRIAGFARHLPAFGWQPHVLTVKPIAYYAEDPSLLHGLDSVRITRTESLDPARLLARMRSQTQSRSSTHHGASTWSRLLHRLVTLTMIPDSKILWLPFASREATKILQREKFDLIFSSGPPHSAHMLAARLSQRFSIPWIADMRDGWAGGNFQRGTALHRSIDTMLEKHILSKANGIVCVSPGLRNLLRQRLPNMPAHTLITNGYDRCDFEDTTPPDARFDIVFMGTTGNFVEATPILHALKAFLQDLPLSPKQIRLHFVGADLAGTLENAIAGTGLQDYVTCTGYLPHSQAVAQLKSADLLLYLVTGSPTPDFVPGKTFEYLASGKPSLAICPHIDGLRILQRAGLTRHVLPDDVIGCVNALRAFYTEFQRGITPRADRSYIACFERNALTAQLADFFNTVRESGT